MIKHVYYLKRKTNRMPLFFVIFIIDLIFHLIVSFATTIYNPELLDVFDKSMSLNEIFVLSVIFAPLIETFLFQYLIVEILSRLKMNFNAIIVISAITFSLIHYYNFIYILVTFLSGVIYATYYVYLKFEKQKSPFMYIFALHALYNFTVFILDDILGW